MTRRLPRIRLAAWILASHWASSRTLKSLIFSAAAIGDESRSGLREFYHLPLRAGRGGAANRAERQRVLRRDADFDLVAQRVGVLAGVVVSRGVGVERCRGRVGAAGRACAHADAAAASGLREHQAVVEADRGDGRV